MALDFPASPTQGQTFQDPATGIVWVFDSGKWRSGAGGGAYLPLSGGALTGSLAGTTGAFSGIVSGADPPAGDSSSKLATTAWINANRPQNRNRIINGGMAIDQRNNGASGTANSYTIDRWEYYGTQTNRGSWQQQASTAQGFSYSLQFTSSSAYTSLATDMFHLYQTIEAYMVSDFAWGTAQAQPVTLSFWVYSSLTGSFSGSIGNPAGTRSYPFSFSIPNANTPTKIAVTIPGDTAGTWVMSGNGGGVQVRFDLGSGSGNRGPANAWAASTYIGVTGAVSVVATNGATFYVTGVQFEIGTQATPWDWRPYGEELALCQRYYQTYMNWLFDAYTTAGASFFQVFMLNTLMRVPPTTALSNQYYQNASTLAISNLSNESVILKATMTETGYGYAAGDIALSAEL